MSIIERAPLSLRRNSSSIIVFGFHCTHVTPPKTSITCLMCLESIMLELPQVTLIALTGQKFAEHDEAIKRSCEGINWGAVKLIYDYNINSIDRWNYAIIYDLWHYVDTEFAMLIHADGFVVNPQAWKDEFLAYDYIGAPWPLPGRDFLDDGYSYRTPEGDTIRVGNSVSIRSKRLLEAPSRLGLGWKSYYGNTNEDGFLCVHNESVLRQQGIKFAPLDVARYFSKEHTIEENKDIPPEEIFAFHQVDA